MEILLYSTRAKPKTASRLLAHTWTLYLPTQTPGCVQPHLPPCFSADISSWMLQESSETKMPSPWPTQTVDPFKLTRAGDKLYGRGTTDCLGHAALVTLLMAELARRRPRLSKTVVAVIIANEENSRVPLPSHPSHNRPRPQRMRLPRASHKHQIQTSKAMGCFLSAQSMERCIARLRMISPCGRNTGSAWTSW